MDFVGHAEIRIGKEWHYFRMLEFIRDDELHKQLKKKSKKGKSQVALTKLFHEYDGEETKNYGIISEDALWDIAKDRDNELDIFIYNTLYMKEEIGFDEMRCVIWETP